MRSLYDRYKVAKVNAFDNLKKSCGDDAFIDACCFQTQQALEFLIKYKLNDLGVSYKKSHDIEYLFSLLQQEGVTFSKERELLISASKVTSWETTYRYGDGITTTLNAIHDVWNIITCFENELIKNQLATENVWEEYLTKYKISTEFEELERLMSLYKTDCRDVILKNIKNDFLS